MLVTLLLGCSPAPSETGADTADVAEPVTANYVVTGYAVAGDGEGFDLDGDGAVDNAVAGLADALDPLIASGLAVAQHVVIEQIGGIDDWSDDPQVRVGVLTAVDEDGQAAGNAGASFDAGAQVDADGEVLLASDTALASGAYLADIATGALTVGSYELILATGLQVAATPTPEDQAGLLGFGITIDALGVALEAEGIDPGVTDLVAALADLDLDGDGTVEAISMAFTFTSSACAVE